MYQLVSNIDEGILYFSKWLQKELQSYPNPSNYSELNLCGNENIVKIFRKEEELAEHFNFIKKESIPISVSILQKGEYEYLYDASSAFKELDIKVFNNGEEDILFKGKSARYKSPISINIVARSLFSCKTLAFYISTILSSLKLLKYPAHIRKDGENVSTLTDYCSMKLNIENPSMFSENPVVEGYYRLSLEFSFTDSYLFFKEVEEEEENLSLTVIMRLRSNDT